MAQTLETIISINAKTGNGFSDVGNTLTQLGSMVSEVSEQLINFGTESVNVYRAYELSMKDAEVALSTTYGRNSKELAAVMETLKGSVTDWAATTKFHTDDVANAVAGAAHAGWDLDQILSGIPAAMRVAQAGGIDLSQAVDYVVKSTSAAGVGFDDMAHFIDLWTFAANSSASTVEEFGEAMTRMGSTMRFAADPEELMTLIAVTANAGAVGSQAGTMIRNSLMRLLAPTEKADSAMAMLGATSEETAALLNDEALMAANAALASTGFTVYDQDTGQIKNILDIYRELYVAVGEAAGSFENLEHNGRAIEILGQIFPSRTITEALTLLRGAAEGYDGLYESMKGGDAEGYGQYAADTMLDSLDGKIEIFESKVERLKQLVGEELSGQVKQVLDGLGNIVDSVAGMDSESFTALVSGLEAVALTGPGLLLAGGAFRLLGTLLSPVGAIALGIPALAGLVTVAEQLKQADFKDLFGNMDLDTQTIDTYTTSIGEDFRNAASEVNQFRGAIAESIATYEEASAAFSSTLFQDMITNAELTDADKEKLTNLGNEMVTAVNDAITTSTASTMQFWNALFGGEEEAVLDPAYQDLLNTTKEAYQGALVDVETISQNMRSALTSAFADNEISPEEYQQILSYMRSYNDAIAEAAAEAQSEEDYIKMGKWLRQAQTASWDDIKGIAASAEADRDEILAAQEDRYLTERFRAEYRGADEESLAAADARFQEQQMETRAAYDDFLLTLWSSQIAQSGLGDQLGQLQAYAGNYLAGELSADTIMSMITGEMGRSKYAGQTHFDQAWNSTQREQLGKMLGYALSSFGNQEGIEERISWYEGKGDTEMADQLRQLYTMEQLINGFGVSYAGDRPWYDFVTDDFGSTNQRDLGPEQANRGQFEEFMWGGTAPEYTLDTARGTIAGVENLSAIFDSIGAIADGADGSGDVYRAIDSLGQLESMELSGLIDQLSQLYNLDAVLKDTGGGIDMADSAYSDMYAIWSLLYGGAAERAENYRIGAPVEQAAAEQEAQREIEVGLSVDSTGLDAEVDAAVEGASEKEVEVGADLETDEYEAKLAELEDNETWITVHTSYHGDVGERPDIAAERALLVTPIFDLSTLQESVSGAGPVAVAVIPQVAEGDTAALIGMEPIPLPIQPYVEGEDPASSLASQGVTMQVMGDTTSLSATIDGEDGQTLMAYVSGDATNLSLSIAAQDGRTLVEHVTGDASQLAALINSYANQTITVNLTGRSMFANGGRATTASVFGEAGPEWAIPEEHSRHTADLLNAARAASGFTWPDLLSMYGGLNAGAQTSGTIIYSPTIQAADARGVERVLIDDKRRLEKWWNEKKILDEVEVYA